MDTITLFVAGDVVNKRHPDGLICAAPLAARIQAADYAVCNFEAPVQSTGEPQVKSGPHHWQEIGTLSGLKRQGFDCVLLANNHMLDFGATGLHRTLQEAERQGLDSLGAGLDAGSAYAPLLRTIGGIKLGMVNACEAQFGVLDYFQRPSGAGYAWINSRRIDETIARLRSACDFVLVFVHAGLENYAIPQKECRERYKQLCDVGADVVIGTHPHVPQGYERYGEKLIFYSLGNFYFDSKKYPDRADATYSVLLTLSKANGVGFEPIFHRRENGVVTEMAKGQGVDLDGLNALLGQGYQELHDAMCVTAYGDFQRNLRYALNSAPFDGSPADTLRRLLRRMLGRAGKIDKEVLQLHLLRNEAYMYAARHALEVICRERLRIR
jgi:hypothetical protein